MLNSGKNRPATAIDPIRSTVGRYLRNGQLNVAEAIGNTAVALQRKMARWNPVRTELRKYHTSGALQAMLIWVVWLDLVVYVAIPVEFVRCDHLDVPKSAICDQKTTTSPCTT